MVKRVAIIGFSCRLPQTDGKTFWQALLDGCDLVTEVAEERWAQESFRHPKKKHPGSSYTFAAGSIGDIAQFDAGFFGISPREATQMDPQQRLLLELSWEALENAGVKPSDLRGSQCGVFIGISSVDYSFRLIEDPAAIDASTATGNTSSIAANRLSYFFDLHGPSMAIDTACSSALVAFHQACQAIIGGECSQALTGGVSLHAHPFGFIGFSKASMLSPRGRCNVFDAAADGYVRSEGGGVFLLKDYDQAIAAGDPILAVVSGSAVNTDGRKSGLTVPNFRQQAALLRGVYAKAGISPAEIDYIEAHGTGTAVGDPLEMRAIGEALGQCRAKDQPLPTGSVKSNLGHLEAASAVAGLVKALYCLRYRMAPATIGIKNLNPNIAFADLNLQVVTENRPLKSQGKLVVGVNSFGFGGSNAHVILESCEAAAVSPDGKANLINLPIVLSGKDDKALKAALSEFSLFLQAQPPAALYDISYNSVFRRDWHEQRAMLYGSTPQAIAEILENFLATGSRTGLELGAALKNPLGPAFIYSGNGSQWKGMGKRLLAEEPVFRQAITEIDAIFCQYADFLIADELAERNGADRFEYTEIAQPVLFAFQVGLTQIFRQRGIKPVAVAGHSVGEVAAAWAAGILTLADAVKVIFYRSKLQGETKGSGQMTAVGLSYAAAQQLLAELGLSVSISIAGINSYRGLTMAGSARALVELELALRARKIFYKRLDLDYAFHSPGMDSIADGVRLALVDLQPGPAVIPYYSTVTGCQLGNVQMDAEYWWRNIREPVLFEQAVAGILADAVNIFIEISPSPILQVYLNDAIADSELEGRVIATTVRGDDDLQRIDAAVQQAIIAGVAVDWRGVFPVPGQVKPLPNYPWQRERYWQTMTPESIGLLSRRKIHPLLGYAVRQQECCWENQIDTRLNPVLADHVVGNSIVFPGSGYAELVLAAAFAWQAGDLVELEDLEITGPLVLSDTQTKLVRVQIDADDGGVIIKSRDYLSAEPWAIHVNSRIVPEPSDILLQTVAPALPVRTPDFSGSSHIKLAQGLGLAYGPAFQCIDYGWIENHAVLAVLKIPGAIQAELEQSYLHPALLDCAFQLIFELFKAELAVPFGVAFIPTHIGRLAFHAGKSPAVLARADFLKRGARSITAEFTLFDTAGVAIACLKDVRFSSIRLSKNPAERLCFPAYHCTPKPWSDNLATPALLSFDSVQAAIIDMMNSEAMSDSHSRFVEEVEPLLDSLCSRFAADALSLSAAPQHDSIVAALRPEGLAVAAELEPFLGYLQGLAADAATESAFSELDEDISAQDIWNLLIAAYPDYFPIVFAIGRIGMNLAALLTGQLSQEQLCGHEWSLTALIRQTLGHAATQQIGLAMQELIEQGLSQLPAGRRLSVVEISDGAPLMALTACADVDFNRLDYGFASTSDFAAEEMLKFKKRFPDVHLHSIGADTAQWPTTPVCQIVVLILDFETLEQAGAALAYARSCLAADGSLIVIGQQPSVWLDFVLGGRENYWTQSQNGHWLSNQRSGQFWLQQLQQFGFDNAKLLDVAPDRLFGAYFLLAQGARQTLTTAGPVQSLRKWLLCADPDGYSSLLAAELTTKLQGCGAVTILASADADYESLLREHGGNGQLEGIVLLAGLSPQADMNAEALLERQVRRCATAAAIIQACETTQTQSTCWLITSGAVSDLLLELRQESIQSATMPPADAALWGFGRTLINEATNYTVRLLDLEAVWPIAAVAGGLLTEFGQADAEQEIILTAAGERYALRLRLESEVNGLNSQTEQQAMVVGPVSLGFKSAGRIGNLRWEAEYDQPPPVLAIDEVEVEVQATGLNFRDVMFVLGLVSDAAIENGFAGPTLGLEFAGVLRRLGGEARGFALGDQVVGFGSACFANRVVTKLDAIAHLPTGVSVAAAATIPSAFFTAYYALHHLARLQPGEKVLIHGAAGGVGIAAIQIAKWRGAEIFATVGSEVKRDFLRLLGVDRLFNSRSLTFADEILAQTDGKGVDVVLNSLSGEAINRNFRVLKPFGRFLELGKRDFYENTKIGLRPFRNNISYFGIDADQLMSACPELSRQLFGELMALFNEGVFQPLPYRLFEAEDIHDAFRYMQQARQIGKIVISYHGGIRQVVSKHPVEQKALVLGAEASYLVTGGLSGFGLKTAEWLAAKGARNLILISRSGVNSAEAAEVIKRLALQGVRVFAAACDMTDSAAVSNLFLETAALLPPLRGIIHAAAVIQDGLINKTDAEQIRQVLAPKVLGAQYLHELTRDMPLDFFVLFSSIASLFGNPGQGSYVAGNEFMNALAKYRRGQGLAATSVCWGAIDDVGFLARNEKIKQGLQSRMGGQALHSAVALQTLERLLLADASNVGVMELDWDVLSRTLPSADSPKFSELARYRSTGSRAESDFADIQQLLALSDADLQRVLTDILKNELAEILRTSADKLDPTLPIQDFGLDSLMGFELIVALEARLQIKLPVMLLSQYPTIAKLVEQIMLRLKSDSDPDSDADDDAMLNQAKQIAAQHGVDLTEEANDSFSFAEAPQVGGSIVEIVRTHA